MAPHIALHEIGVPFEGRPVSFAQEGDADSGVSRDQSGRQGADVADRRPAADRGRRHPVLPGQALPRGGAAAARRCRGRGPGRVVDVVHRLDRASRARSGLDMPRGVGIASTAAGQDALGARHATRSPTSTCSGLFWRFPNALSPRPGELSEPVRALRAHDGAPRRASARSRSSRRSATSCAASSNRAARVPDIRLLQEAGDRGADDAPHMLHISPVLTMFV